jgi:hypothetical protein
MMEQQRQAAGLAKCFHCNLAVRASMALTIAWVIFGNTPLGVVHSQDAKPQQATEGMVRASLHNVKYRFAENVSVQINDLKGAIVAIRDRQTAVFDDKESFKVRIDAAEVAISPQDLANLLNQFVFSRPGSQLAGISVATVTQSGSHQGHLKIKGRLRDKGDLPFEMEGALVPTLDGKLRLHGEKMKALKIPVSGLMGAFGIEIDDLIKSGKVPGVSTEENDLVFDLEQMLPAPRIEGKVTRVRVEPNTIVYTIARDPNGARDAKTASDGKPMPKLRGNYMEFLVDRMVVGKFTMENCDIVILDSDPSDPLDFFLDRYKEQLAAGSLKIGTNSQVRAYIKDYGKLTMSKNPTTPAAAAKK